MIYLKKQDKMELHQLTNVMHTTFEKSISEEEKSYDSYDETDSELSIEII